MNSFFNRNKTTLKLTIFILCAMFYALSTNAVYAQGGDLTVAPARQTLTANPGETKTITIKFLNQSDTPISGVVGAADFIVLDKLGSPEFLDDTTTGLSSRFAAASWVSLPYRRATIAANDKITIQAKISIPSNANPGGKYFGIYFEPSGSVPADVGSPHEAGAVIATRLAGLFYVRVSGPISENAIVSRFETPRFLEYGPITVNTEIINRGDYHIKPVGSISLYDMLGRKIDEKALSEENIFPDATRAYENSLGKQIMLGKFNLKLVASYGETGKVLTASTSLWVFPVRIVLVILLTLIIIILVTIILWKSLKGRQGKLEQKLEGEIKELEELKNKFKDTPPPLTPEAKKE